VGSRWKRIAAPAIGLSAVMAALAIAAGAPIVLFTDDNRLEAAPVPAAGSSEVTQVTASPRKETDSPDGGAAGESAVSAPSGTATAPPVSGPGSGTLAPSPPLVREPAGNSADPGGRDHSPSVDDDGRPEGKSRNGKAKGHDKSHGKGKAKGHDKWHGDHTQGGHGKKGSAPVAFSPPGGKKHDHVAHSGAGEHHGRGHRPRSRSRR
jgi:hypothetical protein